MMHRYRTGEWLGVVTEHGAAVLPGDLESHLVERIWSSLRAGKGLGGVLDALTAAFGTSLSALPTFAVVTFSGTEAGIAVRGPLEVGVVGDDDAGVFTVSGARVTTWSERVSSNPDVIQIVTRPGTATESNDPESFPIADGVIPCSAISLVLNADQHHAVLPQPGHQQNQEPEPVHDAGPEHVHDIAAPEPVSEAAPDPLPSDPPAAPEPESQPVPVDPSRTISDPADTEGNDYDLLLSGETIARSVEDAAIRGDDEGDASQHEPVATQVPRAIPRGQLPPAHLLPSAHVPPPAPPAPPSYPTAPSVRPFYVPSTPNGVIDGLPDFPWDAAVAADEPDNDDTISIEALAEMRRRNGTPAPALPATSRTAQPSSAGRLDVSTGESVVLDRNVIIGRRPKSTRAVADRVPHLLTVPSPTQDISRNHVEIRVEGDHVLAVDQETTNGTRLLRPGRDPERLHPREATMLSFGDVLDLGEGVTVTFLAES